MRHMRPTLALAAVLAFPALADDPSPAPTSVSNPAPRRAAKTPAASAKAEASGAANMIVTKDPETGELRPATAAEREKLLGRRPLVAPKHRAVVLPDGSEMVELGEADMSYAVATKNADGSISRACVHGAAAAGKATSVSASPAPAPSPKSADR